MSRVQPQLCTQLGTCPAKHLAQGREIILHNGLKPVRVEHVIDVGQYVGDVVGPVPHGRVERVAWWSPRLMRLQGQCLATCMSLVTDPALLVTEAIEVGAF